MLAAITALLGIAEGVVGIVKVRELKEYVDKWVKTKEAIREEMLRAPNLDDAKLEQLWKDLDIYEDAIAKQAALLTAA